MKISLPCVPAFHVYLGDPDKELKAATTGSADSAQPNDAGPRKILPGIYAGGKSLAHILRKELQDQRELQHRAAETIQAAWKGHKVRCEVASAAQQSTPYESSAHLQLATYGFSPRNLKDRPVGADQRFAEYMVYQNTSKISDGQPALLHSFQREPELDFAIATYKVSAKWKQKGNIYNPIVSGFGDHDMRLNGMWVLGLAHHNKRAVLTTSLDDEILVRQSAKKGPPEKRNTEHNFSALGREVLGMVQNGHFVPRYDARHGLQILYPTRQARLATLEDFKTPSGMKQDEIREKLAAKGIDVSKISTSN